MQEPYKLTRIATVGKREGRGTALSRAPRTCTADYAGSCNALSKSFLLFLAKLREIQVDWEQGREGRGLKINSPVLAYAYAKP